jgi:pre-rRNA-processing protein TSR3
MRSSGSTRSPSSSAPIRLYLTIAGDDHPRACTGRRLLARGLARRARVGGARTAPPILLDPYASEPLTTVDATAAARGGILVVDCSWNRLSVRGHLTGAEPRAIRRRLPLLIATNPQHYGRPAQLNTVEAFAAALALLGRPGEAARVLAGFRGSDSFLETNAERIVAYRGAEAADEIRAAERRLFGGADAG